MKTLLSLGLVMMINLAYGQTLLIDFETGQSNVDNNCAYMTLCYYTPVGALSGNMSMSTIVMGPNIIGPSLDTPEFWTDGELWLTTRAVSLNNQPHMWVYSINPNLGFHNPVGVVSYTDTLTRVDTFGVSVGEFIRFYWSTNTGFGLDRIIIDDITSYTPNACYPLGILPPLVEDPIVEDSVATHYYTIDGKPIEYDRAPPGLLIRVRKHPRLIIKIK